MKVDRDILYADCPCGSGKKFKFCCFESVRNELYDDIGKDEIASIVEERLASFANDPGVDPVIDRAAIEKALLGKKALLNSRFADSARLFQEVRTACPNMVSAWDCEATSLWVLGEYEKALEVAKESLGCPEGGTDFGLAQLAMFEYFLGKDAEYSAHVAAAVRKGRPRSIHAAHKVCSALALGRRHNELFDYALRYGAAREPDLAFYAAVAAANLGNRQDAQRFVDIVLDGDNKNVLAEWLAAGLDEALDGVPEAPCPFGDWQYFRLDDYPAHDLIGKAIAERLPEHRNVICDLAEMLLAEHSIDKAAALEALASYDGGRVSELRRFLAGTRDYDEIDHDEYESFQTAGDEIAMQKTLLDFGFGPVVLNGWAVNEDSMAGCLEEDAFDKAVMEATSDSMKIGSPRWNELCEFFHALYEKYPDRVPCAVDYANMLREGGAADESNAILLRARNANPNSVLVAATAIRYALADDDKGKAGKIIRSFRLPGRMHRNTYEIWLDAKREYYENVHDYASVANIRNELERIRYYSRNQT